MLTQEVFVGIARAAGGMSGRCVCVDGQRGRPLQEFLFAWTPAKLRQVLLELQAAQAKGIEVTVGVEAEDLDEEMVAVFAEVPLLAKGIERTVVDGLFDCLRRKQRTVRGRARCIAQLLLFADYPPVPLRAQGRLVLARW